MLIGGRFNLADALPKPGGAVLPLPLCRRWAEALGLGDMYALPYWGLAAHNVSRFQVCSLHNVCCGVTFSKSLHTLTATIL